ncbi:MAG: hypothetical protein HY854_05645 [Burkholderiales bacterium]|nr:hypothetical protein [Burkholderiales bacterium]
MHSFKKIAAVFALMAVVLTARGDWAYTYSGLAFDVDTSHSGYSACTTLYVDATGDPGSLNATYTMYGTLACGGPNPGYYAVDGSAYFSGNTFNFTVDVGVASKLSCVNMSASTFSGGTCTMYTGASSSPAFVFLL